MCHLRKQKSARFVIAAQGGFVLYFHCYRVSHVSIVLTGATMCARIADARDPQRRNLTSVIVYGDQMVSTSPVKYPTFVTHNSTKICADIHFSQKRKLTFTPTSCQNCNFSCIVVFDSPINPNCTLYLKGQCAAFMGIY